MSGRSQALRLPAKLRLQAKEVRVEQIGTALWLQPQVPPEQDMGAWLSGFELHPWPLEATHHCASVRTALEQAGRPIGGMDLMIAAHALAEDSVLITNNAREFHRVPGLAVEEWALP
ncbi:hypothetical protein EV685_3397 [Sphaerotilus mobilis]|uniref:PIN domain-containing protein n=2 Tax=Sphaerotilus mobilis TaxID=47994 RepID=A0A4Q7LCU0_9BURK|nr:hypothetical protein EV685_3397 [Sphaerotilus mobilis]